MRTDPDVFDLEAANRRLEGELAMEQAKCHNLLARITSLEAALTAEQDHTFRLSEKGRRLYEDVLLAGDEVRKSERRALDLEARIASLIAANARLADLHRARVRSARREARRLPR